MNIMITGATGFVGTKLMKSLLNEGHTLYPIIRSEKKINQFLANISEEESSRVHPIAGDITQHELGLATATQIELTNRIDILYHTAAFLSFNPADRDKTFFVNVEGTRHAISLAKKLSIPSFYHVSTAYTLGMDTYSEETLHSTDREFVNDYEESKCLAEHLVWEQRHEFNISIFRPAIIVGDSNTGEADTTFALYGLLKAVGLIKKLADRGRISADETIHLLSNGEASNNVVPVNYVVDVLTAAVAHAEASTIYHIANNEAPSNKKVVEWIKEISGVDQLEIVEDSSRLTKKDEVINEPMSVFHSYLTRTVIFEDSNTKKLLFKAGKQPINLTHVRYRMLIETYFTK
ncbi:SDR family NAD(P)-dependent oxidoreductase [Jeotgalibacillus sp. S-D1]|uniref:SDR family NAD(P)-dependent oxidoreductase n=1 Tax=Jeotgalibacillus sp. S-D1 TaxID=2552189 RepID=UPI001404A4BB|nr:SDR family NAD(P)-dependent oxidoreductase [Jeotgalibacillus sp. S-D1]